MRSLIALILIMLASSVGLHGALAQAVPSLRVTKGRATVVHAGKLHRMAVGTPDQLLTEGGHVELGLHDRVELRISHAMSLTVRDYSSFGVAPQAARAGSLRLQFLFLGSADIELRRGSLGIDLPQDWSLEVGRSSLYINELVDGRIELIHRGGQPLEIKSKQGGRRGAPKRLLSGQRLVLATR